MQLAIYFSLRTENSAAALLRLAVTARNVWAVTVGAAVGGALVGPPLVRLTLPVAYHAAAPLLPILIVGFLGTTIYYLIGGPEIYYSKQSWALPAIVWGSAAIDIAISSLTAAHFGAVGVAWGMSARLLTMAVAAGIISIRLVKIPFSWPSLVRISACGVAAYAIALLLARDADLQQVVVGLAAILGYVALLTVTGDPSVRAAAKLARSQLAKWFRRT